MIGILFPTWTPKIDGENSISELEYIDVNGTELMTMIRGHNKNNPVVLVVHGGPCCSEIPYIRKYQEELEKEFTMVHYDQRGTGKSYNFFEDYSGISIELLVDDVIELSRQLSERFDNKQIILMGHSFGTYLSIQAVAESPELYDSYIGIGQMGNQITSELDNLKYCIEQAQAESNQSDVDYLERLQRSVENGEIITPRKYVRKYGGAARQINESKDMIEGFLLNPEYNLLDIIRYYVGIVRFQDTFMQEAAEKPLDKLVQSVDIPVWFIMGKYDHMTSTLAAQEYFDIITAPKKTFIIYEDSAHYPQLEEKERFANWMIETYKNQP